MLEEFEPQHDYRSGRDSLLGDFYIPCLQEAVYYDRAVGYFSSTLLHVVAVAFSDFVRRDGRMRLICSPALRPEDFDAMKAAADPQAQAQGLVRRELEELLARPETVPATKLLASLVAAGVLEVRLAFTETGKGIFHDKLGIFADADGARVSFVGSANETWAAWGLNHESFEVFCSWRGEAELLRTRRHARDFERLWDGNDEGVSVEPLDGITRDQLLEIADEDLERAIAAVRTSPERPISSRSLMPHQLAALDSWRDNNHRGIVAFATGAGKTLTAIAAVREWTEGGKPALILVPGRELHDQWRAELAQEMPHATPLLCGAGADLSHWGHLLPAYTGELSQRDIQRVTLATNATYASQEFQDRLQDGRHLFIVGDEMHRLGSTRSLAALGRTHTGATLGLSATHRRQFDELGTAELEAWFGPVLDPVIGLAEAIAMGRLVPYDYRLHTLQLDEDELESYRALTLRIGQIAARGGGDDPSDYLRMLLIQRARLLKKARGKVQKAVDVLVEEFESNERWLVYCDDVEQLKALTTQALLEDLPVMEFHSSMASDRDAVLRSLADNAGIVVAIRCLDEGVDLPACDRALILASSTVEREYIQRRGRVLRVAPGKVSATVHDLLLVDEGGGVLTRGEAHRALEFARLARNPAARSGLQLLLALSPDLEDLPGMGVADAEDEWESGRDEGT